mmetsp:Transcript_48413/g.122100  ORF Transcript_48413/g.122100 Transcript_48413/m.122100 type:complete len:246 (+) Transcript_48413:708-1445(+)
MDHVHFVQLQAAFQQRLRCGLYLTSTVLALSVAKAFVQHQTDGPNQRKENEASATHQGHKLRCQSELAGTCEDRGRCDLAKDEHHRNRKNDSQPRRHKLIEEERQSLIRTSICEQQCYQEGMATRGIHPGLRIAHRDVARDQGQNLLGVLLVLQQLLLRLGVVLGTREGLDIVHATVAKHFQAELIERGQAQRQPCSESCAQHADHGACSVLEPLASAEWQDIFFLTQDGSIATYHDWCAIKIQL